MDDKILCVDDDLNILLALQRQLRKQFRVESALGAEKALAAIARDGPYAVVVSDLQMPGMNGLDFLSKLREISPDTVRVMLTGQADLNTAIAALNQGNIFRFHTKPCSAEDLARTLGAAVAHYHLVTAERHVLENTLRGCVRVLTEILSVVHPAAFSRASRIQRYVRHMASELKLASAWQYDVAAMLSQIGCLTMDHGTLDHVYTGQELSEEERSMYAAHPAAGRDLLACIPRLESVAQMIAGQNLSYARRNALSGMHRDEAIPLGAALLHAALDFDRLISRGRPADEALASMRRQPEDHCPQCLTALDTFVAPEGKMDAQVLKLAELRTDMVIDQDVRAKNGLLLLARGQEVTPPVLGRLRAFGGSVGIAEPIRVLVLRAEVELSPA